MQINATAIKDLHLCLSFSKTVDRKHEFYTFCTPSFKINPMLAHETFGTNSWKEFARDYNVTECAADSVFSKIFLFLENWDTQALSPLEKAQERKLYDCFFMSQYDPHLEVKKISWIRKNNPAKYSLILRSNHLKKIQQIYFQFISWEIKHYSVDNVFNEEKSQLNRRQIETKKEITLQCQTYYVGLVIETHKFSANASAQEIRRRFLKTADITLPNPLTIKRCLLAPSIEKVHILILTQNNFIVKQTIY